MKAASPPLLSPENVTTDWLSRTLSHRFGWKKVPVRSVSIEPLEECSSLLSRVTRLRIDYDSSESCWPTTLIGKFPASAPEPRSIARSFRFYERETLFYLELSDTVSLPVPQCFFAAYEAETDLFTLLLEDISGARAVDQIAGYSKEEAYVTLAALARFHAANWNFRRDHFPSWMPCWNDGWLMRAVRDSYVKAYPQFVLGFGSELPSRVLELSKKLGSNIELVAALLAGPPTTVAHGDVRGDNLLLTSGRTTELAALLDWQIVAIGKGAFDLGYFLSLSGPTELRRLIEQNCLRNYLEILRDCGVRDYKYEELLEDYRTSLLYTLVYVVITCGFTDLSDPHATTLARTILERCLAAISDHDAWDILVRAENG